VTAVIERDLAHVWHPTSQMKEYETYPPLVIARAEGPYLITTEGKPIIDAISSWWCKSLGHGHPALRAAIQGQLQQFDHVIFADITYEKAVCLAEKLSRLSPSLNKVFFASDGSSSIEIAVKMAVQAQQLRGDIKRTQLMALKNGYHGETCLTLALSDVGHFRKPFESLLLPVKFIEDLPYIHSRNDPLWENCDLQWKSIESQLEAAKETLCAIVLEPIVQGAGGFYLYSPDCLKRLRKWTEEHNVFLIADEIMTGFGRTGLPLACHHAGIEPDFLCLAKHLTAGSLPLSATLTRDSIYHLFYDDVESGKAFLHSHTHSGNALAVASALAALEVYERDNIYHRVQQLEPFLWEQMQHVAQATGRLNNIRHIGALVAADLITDQPRAGHAVYREAVKLGALLRPIGNTLYWLPPLNVEFSVIEKLRDITLQAIHHVFSS